MIDRLVHAQSQNKTDYKTFKRMDGMEETKNYKDEPEDEDYNLLKNTIHRIRVGAHRVHQAVTVGAAGAENSSQCQGVGESNTQTCE